MKKSTLTMFVVFGVVVGVLVLWTMAMLQIAVYSVIALVVGAIFWALLLKARREIKQAEAEWQERAETIRQEASQTPRADYGGFRPRGAAPGLRSFQ